MEKALEILEEMMNVGSHQLLGHTALSSNVCKNAGQTEKASDLLHELHDLGILPHLPI